MGNCFSPSFVSYFAAPTNVDFGPCFSPNLTAYGLQSAIVVVKPQIVTQPDGTTIVTTNLQFDIPTENNSVFLNFAPSSGRLTLLNPGQTPGLVTIIGNQATVSFFAANLPPLLFIFNFNPDIIIPDAVQGNLSFSVFEPGSVPNVTATTYPSPDRQQICQLDFTVTLAKDCAVVTSSYKQYCPNFASVINCKDSLCNCTLRQALNCLELNNEQSFLQYMVLRYIIGLSVKGLGPPTRADRSLSGFVFGCFSVKYLRQKYNKCFLKALDTPEYEAFLPVLEANPEYATFFIC